jgi:diaminohydroxyphosphoribosylaminopyrimidine deaminase / 5-amino-6-(5-phosphoribosylamino)uracil reductase
MTQLLPSGFGLGGHIETSLLGPQNQRKENFLINTDRYSDTAMGRALIASMLGVGHTIPNPAVGCVIVKDGVILAEGATEMLGGRHAERVAFDTLRACGMSSDSTEVYVTLEPCSHFGRQPPCCELFKNSGIARLHAALKDPNPKVSGQGFDYIRKLQIPIVLSEGQSRFAATAWLLPFLVQNTLNRPLMVAKWAQTLDGATADHFGNSQWITGPSARAHGHWLRLKYDVTAIGLSTLIHDKPLLTVRDCWRANDRQPHVCVIDPLGRFNPNNEEHVSSLDRLVSAADNRQVALMSPADHSQRISEKINMRVNRIPIKNIASEKLGETIRNTFQSELMAHWLGRMPQSVYVEGGATLLSLLFEADCIDAMHVFTAPKLLGGQAKRVGSSTHTTPALAMASHFDILSTTTLGDDILVELTHSRITHQFFS